VDTNQIETLLAKSVADNLNAEEKLMLGNWVAQSKENKKKLEAYTQFWERSKKLALSNSIDVDSSLIKTKKRIPEFQPGKHWIRVLRQAAAILVLSFSLSLMYHYILKSDGFSQNEQIVYQEVKAARGTHTKLVLADGTKVWLNSESTLLFPMSFNKQDERKVKLNGEGYFEVTKDDAKPFIVNTSKLDVKVYGTAFNVFAYEGEPSMTVALAEGKVSLVKEYKSGPKELILLKPNEVVEYDYKKNSLNHFTDLNLYKHIAWKDGYMVFFGDPINTVVQKLEKWYNVDIEIQDQALQNYSFTATFADESLDQVLNLLSLSSPIAYKITPAHKQTDNSFSRRKVNLRTRKQIH
jgi:ferric-dicitrate binding protein FerR (iron transport regulator)